MKIETLDWAQALERGRRLPWAFVRSLSGVSLGPPPEKVEAEELLEARFFDARREVRLFRREDGLEAVRLEEEPGDRVFLREYRLEDPRFGSSVMACFCLDIESDEDGQALIAAVRLAGWRGE